MGKNNRRKVYRIDVTEEATGDVRRSWRFTRLGEVLSVVTAFIVISGAIYALIAFTPLRTTIPGYPDSHSRKEAVSNAIKIDSLESVITRWKLYSENLSRVLSGDSTLNLDSLIQSLDAPNEAAR